MYPAAQMDLGWGIFGAKAGTVPNRYPGTSCPAGQTVTSRESVPRSPGFIGDKTYDDFVNCKPIAAPRPVAAPRPAAGPVYRTTISPTFQQAFTPQVSPTIQVTADSPGAQVGATTQQTAPGGQQAEGGGSGAGFDEIAAYLEQQAATASAERSAAEFAARAREDMLRDELRIEREAAAADVTMFRDRETEAAAARQIDLVGKPAFIPAPEPVFIPAPARAAPQAPTTPQTPLPSATTEPSVWIWVAVGAGALLLLGGGVFGAKKRATRRSKS